MPMRDYRFEDALVAWRVFNPVGGFVGIDAWNDFDVAGLVVDPSDGITSHIPVWDLGASDATDEEHSGDIFAFNEGIFFRKLMPSGIASCIPDVSEYEGAVIANPIGQVGEGIGRGIAYDETNASPISAGRVVEEIELVSDGDTMVFAVDFEVRWDDFSAAIVFDAEMARIA